MHYLTLPMVPLAIAGALFLNKRWAAYAVPMGLILIKILMTQPAMVYLFITLGLLVITALTRKLNSLSGISLPKVALTAALGVVVYALASGFGVWILGACTGGERLYALNLSGLLASYKSGLAYTGFHLLKAVPTTLVLVQALEWLRQRNMALNLQRVISNKI